MSSTRIRSVPLARTIAGACAALALLASGAQAEAPASTLDLRLCGAEAKTSEYQDLALYDTGAGMALRTVPVDELVDELAGVAAKSGGIACAKSTAAGLAVEFPGQDPILLAGPVSIAGGNTQISVLDPALCTSYAASGAGMSIDLVDFNGNHTLLPGWTSVRYDLTSRGFVPVPADGLRGPVVQCHTFPWDQLLSNPPQYGVPGEDFGIFGGSFENRGNLLVEIIDPATGNRTGELDITQDLSATWQVRISNTGESPVAGVRIREFLPKVNFTPVISDGTWSCTHSHGTCPSASGTGAIDATGVSLGRGHSMTFEITRELPGALPGAKSMVAVAAFVNPNHATAGGEKDPADNAQPLVLTVVANQAPTVACAPTTLNSLLEDDPAAAVSCTAVDADGDAIDVIVVDDTGDTDSPVVLDNVVQAGAQVDFTVTPKPDASGTTTIHVTATDVLGATGAPFALPVTVAPVNDAPTFAVASTTLEVFDDGSDPDGQYTGGPVLCTAGISGFNCEAAILAFFDNFDPGAPDEASQTLTPVVTALGTLNPAHCGVNEPGESIGHFFAKLPSVVMAPGGETAAMSFIYKTTATGSVFCDFRFQDSGGAISDPIRVTFTMHEPPPETP